MENAIDRETELCCGMVRSFGRRPKGLEFFLPGAESHEVWLKRLRQSVTVQHYDELWAWWKQTSEVRSDTVAGMLYQVDSDKALVSLLSIAGQCSAEADRLRWILAAHFIGKINVDVLLRHWPRAKSAQQLPTEVLAVKYCQPAIADLLRCYFQPEHRAIVKGIFDDIAELVRQERKIPYPTSLTPPAEFVMEELSIAAWIACFSEACRKNDFFNLPVAERVLGHSIGTLPLLLVSLAPLKYGDIAARELRAIPEAPEFIERMLRDSLLLVRNSGLVAAGAFGNRFEKEILEALQDTDLLEPAARALCFEGGVSISKVIDLWAAAPMTERNVAAGAALCFRPEPTVRQLFDKAWPLSPPR